MRIRQLRSQAAAKSGCTEKRGAGRLDQQGQQGFGLVEVLVSTLILAFGLVSVAQLLAVTTTVHMGAREAARATRDAQAKVDGLMKLNFTRAPEIQLTPLGANSLNTNVANYFDQPSPGLTRRWLVQAGPSADTRLLTMRVLNSSAANNGRQIDLITVIRRW